MRCQYRPLIIRFILVIFAVIAFTWFIGTLGCTLAPKTAESWEYWTPATNVNEKVHIVWNSPGLVKAWGKGSECSCGLRVDDFKRYVAWRIEGMDVLKVRYEWKDAYGGERCLGSAVIYLKKGREK